ncbi:MAG: T9SS type A sorting domain-containing protein [Flavobacteriales bacterium]
MKQLLCLLAFTSLISSTSLAQVLYGLLRTSNPASVKLGTLDLVSGSITGLGQSNVATSINLTGAALDITTNQYYFLTQGGTNGVVITVGLNNGVLINQAALINPISPSYFDNFRFNTSDSTLYGLARRYIPGTGPGQGTGELYFSSMNPATGEITQISPQSITDSYSISGNAIDPHQMVYYFSKGSQFYGIDMYNGQIYTAPTISFAEGGLNFDNYTYNCADTTIYGIIRATNTPPITAYLGKIDPSTGVVTRVSQTALDYNTYSVNGSSTIDPFNGIYYYVSQLPGGGVGVIGISIITGALESVFPVSSTTAVTAYFDMIRHPSDCLGAAAYRPNNNGGGGASIENLNPTSSKIYPNPFTNFLTIETSAKIISLKMSDLQGKELVTALPLLNKAELDLQGLPSGIYILEIQTENNLELLKVVK